MSCCGDCGCIVGIFGMFGKTSQPPTLYPGDEYGIQTIGSATTLTYIQTHRQADRFTYTHTHNTDAGKYPHTQAQAHIHHTLVYIPLGKSVS